jgi:hypothetical protein
MKKIGIDFGTTNSTIAYRDERTKAIVEFKLGGVGDGYVPSAIAYPRREEDKTRIGKLAKEVHRNTPENYYYYEYYKLNLLSDCRQILDKDHDKPVIEIVKDYLHELIALYKKENDVKQFDYIDFITLSLPNVIMIEDDKNENYKTIKAELKAFLDKESKGSEFYGEAQCACEFYISKEENKDFTGNIVVVDYGGGTLDISNCSVTRDDQKKPQIDVISQQGTNAGERSKFGNAGVAFDRGVVRNLDGLTGLSEADELEYAREFERFKLENHERITDQLENFFKNDRDGDENDPLIWTLKDVRYSPKPSILVKTFNDINLTLLTERFNEIVPEENRKSGGAASQGSFRVLPTGGFSRLYCVEKAIKDLLGIGSSVKTDDQRIARVNPTEKFLAVAYGAALLGELGKVVEKTCPFEIGVKTFDGQDYKSRVLVKENTDSQTLREVKWSDDSCLIIDAARASVKVYCRTSTSGESERDFDISSACVDNCRLRLGVTAEGNSFSLRVSNENTREQAQFDITQLPAEYKGRNRR